MELVKIYFILFIKVTILTNFLAFYLLFLNFFLLDPDAVGKMYADPDPQPCFYAVLRSAPPPPPCIDSKYFNLGSCCYWLNFLHYN